MHLKNEMKIGDLINAIEATIEANASPPREFGVAPTGREGASLPASANRAVRSSIAVAHLQDAVPLPPSTGALAEVLERRRDAESVQLRRNTSSLLQILLSPPPL